MKCPACSFENPDGFAFCGKCGAQLVLYCPNCGAEAPPGFAFCGQCGTRLAPDQAPSALITDGAVERLKPYLPPQQLEDLPPAPLWQREHLTRAHRQLSTLLDVVITYLPRYLVQTELAQGDTPPVGGAFLDGALLFADISGFTALSERMSTLGTEGAEQITALVNRYFRAMLEVLFAYGGDLLKFGGDALLAFFPDQPSAVRARQSSAQAEGPSEKGEPISRDVAGGSISALQAAQAMQEAMTAFHRVETSLGTFPLQMKIGLHTGPIFTAHVGTADERGFIVTGPTVNATAQAEGLASAGQILISPAVYEQVRSMNWLAAAEGPAGHYLVQQIIPQPSPTRSSAPLSAADLRQPGDESNSLRRVLNALERLTPYLPPGLLPRLIPDPTRHETSGEHRLVAILFANFVGASEFITRLGRDRADEIAQALHTYFVVMRQAVARYGGVINKVDIYDRGDKLMALFGAPVAHEDDAERAVRAGLEMQAAVELAEPLILSQQIGISTGLVFAGHVGAFERREYTVLGDEVNLAARLMSTAQDGEILLSSFVARKVGPFFELADRGMVTLKGKSNPVPTHAIIGRRAQPEPVRGIRGLRSPLVGRADEEEALQRLVSELRLGRGNIVSLIGEAGLGKSRLVAELRSRILDKGDLTWLEGRCLSYTQQVSYSAFTELIHSALSIVETDSELDIRVKLHRRVEELLQSESGEDILPYLAHFLGLRPSGPQAERVAYLEGEALQRQILRSVAVFLEHLARERPLVLAFDDLHWADSASLALLERCLTLTDHAPALILLIYRPERAHGCWALGQTAARNYPHRFTEITLSPLDRDAGQDEQLVCNLLRLKELPAGLARLISRAEGNPFYVEEIIRTLIDQGAVVQDNGYWKLDREVDLKTVPDTLQGIIMARLDRLMEETRRTLQLASVIGRTFRHRVLEWLASAAALAAQLDTSLASLQRAELIRERSRLPELEFGFKHVMIRDVAYESLLVRDRQTYHQLVARHLEEIFIGQKREEIYELLAHHYSLSDDRDKALTYLIKAAEKARAEYANPEAIAFYRQAEALAKELDRTQKQADVAEGLGNVLFHIGEYDDALACYQRALRHCTEVRQEAELHRRLGMVQETRGEYDAALEAFAHGIELLSPDRAGTAEMARLLFSRSRVYQQRGQNDAALADAKASIAILEGSDHYREIAQAHNRLGLSYRDSQPAKAIEHFEQGLAILERIGDEYEAARVYGNLGILYHQTDLSRSAAYFARTLETMQRLGNVWGESQALLNLGNIHYLRGDYAAAIDCYQRSLRIKERLGDNLGIADLHINLSQIYRAQDDPAQAIVHLEQALAIAQEIDASDAEAECHRQLAACYLETDDPERALAACVEALAHAQEIGNPTEEGIIHRFMGNAQLQLGDPAAAVSHLEQSVAILRELDLELDLGMALCDYAQALTNLEQKALAREQLLQALTLFERLELPHVQARVQTLLSEIG